ncbi:MAG: rhomboid family intramembrane serine protease [Victivallales bacterium]|nr:rhomboid family intramembrane serine protease [Victivallales bacterium]
MFSERRYRNDSNPYRNAEEGVQAMWGIMIACGIIFLLNSEPVIQAMWLDAPDMRKFEFWRLITYMFVHGGFAHIFFNMWGLYIFGKGVAMTLGRTRFLWLYFISGIMGGLLWLLTNWDSPFPVVGASGALFGVMLAMAMIYPDQQYMLLIPPIPMKCKTLVIVFGLLELLFEYSGAEGGVAHLAHLGGIVGGYIYLKLACRRYLRWDPLGFLFRRSGGSRDSAPSGWTFVDGKKPSPPKENKYDRGAGAGNSRSYNSRDYRDVQVSTREIDRLLDKISRSGINSLTAEEMETLRQAREQMKRS